MGFRALLTIGIVLFSLFQVTVSQTSETRPPSDFHEWQVIDVKTGRPVVFEAWMTILADKNVIYLGEEHRNHWHIDGAIRVLRTLLERGREPILALEMFGWDGRQGLSQYLLEETSRDQFLRLSRWEENWGGSFDDYAPLIDFARDHHLPVLALNPPRPLVRRVATQGLARVLKDDEMSRWEMQNERFMEDQAYRDLILRQLRLCHGGLSEDGYQRMYEASLFRDEGMAKVIAEFFAHKTGSRKDGPLLSYTGGGHVQYHLPVPNRVWRRTNGAVEQVTVYMTSFDPVSSEEIDHLLQEAIADYIWLTPMGAHGPAKRCR